jgi:hypothetical protein
MDVGMAVVRVEAPFAGVAGVQRKEPGTGVIDPDGCVIVFHVANPNLRIALLH